MEEDYERESKGTGEIPSVLTVAAVSVGAFHYNGLFVGLVSVKAGIIVSSFTVVYVGIALWIYFSRKRGIAAAMVEFAASYNQMQLQVMNEMLVAYAVADENGRLLWMNREFVRIMGGEKSAPKNLLTLFPEIKREQLATGGDVVTLHSSYGGRNYRIDLHQVSVTRTEEGEDALPAVFDSEVTAVYLLDETQTLKYMQQINDQKLVAGLIYLDNYDEALESVEEVRRSLLTALIDRKINKYIAGMNGIVKKMEKDKYFFAIKQQYIPKIQEDRFSILEDVKTVNIGNDMAVTLSIGIGMNGDTYSQNYEYARTSIDMALAAEATRRVVKDADKIQYYGGKAQQMEKPPV